MKTAKLSNYLEYIITHMKETGFALNQYNLGEMFEHTASELITPSESQTLIDAGLVEIDPNETDGVALVLTANA